jgi:RNA polymerase sigma factor (sigma-70 family)
MPQTSGQYTKALGVPGHLGKGGQRDLFCGESMLDTLRTRGGLTEYQKALVDQFQYIPRWALGKMRHDPGDDFDDLIQAGLIALMHAATKYDPSRNASFKSYACHWVYGTMRAAARRRPREYVVGDSDVLYKTLTHQEQDNDFDHELIPSILSHLSERDRAILLDYFYLTNNCEELGHRYGISRQRAFQLVTQSIARCQTFARDGLGIACGPVAKGRRRRTTPSGRNVPLRKATQTARTTGRCPVSQSSDHVQPDSPTSRDDQRRSGSKFRPLCTATL